ncbi:MAG: threonine aldolase family protein [Candidatus Paceibacterota bacterium]
MNDNSKVLKSFASDNYSGVHPVILEAMAKCNTDHEPSYGSDRYTESLNGMFSELFLSQVRAYPMLTGTGANIVALKAALKPWQSVICSTTAHINVDEGGAPEMSGGVKLLTVGNNLGKISVDSIKEQAWGWGDQHRSQPGLVSITQSSELGTTYTLSEIEEISEFCKKSGMRLHVDGARLPNAMVSENHKFADYVNAGVDIISLGGTKCGSMISETIIVINNDINDGIKYIRKSSSQLYSKMRFLSAQTHTLYSTNLWHDLSSNANVMARLLREQLQASNILFPYPTQANAVFAIIPKRSISLLQKKWSFYVWDESINLVRWMTSWDTTEADVYGFVNDIKESLV